MSSRKRAYVMFDGSIVADEDIQVGDMVEIITPINPLDLLHQIES